MKKAVIMAGGEGVRLRPLTYALPKPLLPIGSYTAIEYVIKMLAENGVGEVFILVHYQHQKFEVCLAYQKKYGIKIKLVKEESKLGTFGGLIHIKKELTDPFLIINSDIITRLDVKDMFRVHDQKNAVCTLGVRNFAQKVPYGVVELDKDDNFIGVVEKPVNNYLISAGINIFSPDALSYLDGKKLDVPQVVERLSSEGKKIGVYKIDRPWLDIGQAKDYEKAIELLEMVEDQNDQA